MPLFKATTELDCSAEALFDFLSRPANVLKISPEEWHLHIVEAPDQCRLGSQITVQARRWGVPQKFVSKITAFEPHVLMTDELLHGPFRKFVHEHRLEALGQKVRMLERIDFEPPGGLLGIVMTASRIQHDLAGLHEYRLRKFKELLESATAG
jgi:ligand-binding SRPBCC domain-containing protein